MMNNGVRFGLNLGGLSYWSPETKFVDIAKQSQEWITERLAGQGVHQWDTHEHDTLTWRSDGYPASLPSKLLELFTGPKKKNSKLPKLNAVNPFPNDTF